MTDTPTRPNTACEHRLAVHYHGTRASYSLDGCRCGDCQTARKRYDRHRSKWVGEFPTVLSPRVNAEPVRQHLQTLMAEGMGPKRISAVSGISHGAVSKLLYGDYNGRPPSKTITRKNADTLLGLELDLADGARVNGREATAIVTELVARGWTKRAIAARIGDNPNPNGLQIGRTSTVLAGTVRRLRQLLLEPVPLRRHSTGRMYKANVDHTPRHIPENTHGAPSDWYPGSPVWLAEMRSGLKQAVEQSYDRHGRVAA